MFFDIVQTLPDMCLGMSAACMILKFGTTIGRPIRMCAVSNAITSPTTGNRGATTSGTRTCHKGAFFTKTTASTQRICEAGDDLTRGAYILIKTEAAADLHISRLASYIKHLKLHSLGHLWFLWFRFKLSASFQDIL